MARISNTKWNELVDNEQVLVETLEHLIAKAPNNSKGKSESTLYDLKYLAYDALSEATQGWSCEFGKEVREAVYEHNYKIARNMVSTKTGLAKDRVMILISIIEMITEGGDN
ncbi:MAG: hypothetical protein ACI4E1_12240 [Lachnospira sp.]